MHSPKTLLDQQLRAIADPTRRSIMTLLAGQEQSAGDIAERFELSRPAISRHLKVLREARLIDVRGEATNRYYQQNLDTTAELRRWFEQFWDQGLPKLKALAEAEAKTRWSH